MAAAIYLVENNTAAININPIPAPLRFIENSSFV